jgi:RNA polymerase sigma-70 factor (ECF subfamily)
VIDEAGGTLALAVHREEHGAIERLVQSYQNQLFGYALRLLQDPSDAQEVTQDAFLRAYDALTARYDANRCRTLALRPWLFRITRNIAYNRRRARRSAQEEAFPEADGWHSPALRYESGAAQSLEMQEERARLERALGRLSQTSRELIVLRFVEELPYAAIADVVGAGEAAVRGKVFRALRQLRAMLTEMEAHDAQ